MNSTRFVWLVVSWCMSLLAAMAQQDTNSDTTVTSTPAISLSGIPSLHHFDARDIRSLPVRGMDQLLSLVPGVVYQNGELHFRGGRAGEVRYHLDGHAITNAFTSRPMFEPIPEALEEINVSTGVSDARLGRALSGQVLSRMKTGGQQLEIFGDLRTDEFVGTGKEFLGTTSFGHRDAILTLGGPVPGLDQTRFFLAGRHLFLRNRQPRFVTPFSLNLQANQYSDPFPGPLVIDQATFANNTEEQNAVQGNIVHEDGPLRVQLTGHYGTGSYTLGSEWPSRIQRFYNQRRNSEMKTTSAFFGLTGRYAFTPSTSLEVRASYGMHSTRTVDPDFGETWTLYADSAANSAIGYRDFSRRWDFLSGYETEYWLRFDRTGRFNNSYSRQSQSSWTGALEVKHSLTDRMFLTFALDVERWTMRAFSIGDISSLMTYYYGTRIGGPPRTFASPEARRWLAARVGNVDAFGYDVDGNAMDEGPDAPYHPLFVSASASHTWHLAGFVFETGIRFESYNMGIGMFRDPRDPHLVVYNGSAEVIPQENVVDSKTYGLLLPRIRAQYSAQSGTEVILSAGSYAQLPSLDRVLHSYPYMVRPLFHDGAFSRPIGLMVQPERCELFEAELRQPLGEHARLEVVAYLKDAWNLITIRRIRDAGFWDYAYYANANDARMKGLELSLGLDNGGGLRARLAYALSEVRGTGSYPGSSIGYVEDYPARLPPTELYLLDHDQTHRGTVFLSARIPGSAGPMLDGLTFSLLMTFNSGHSFAMLRPRTTREGYEPLLEAVADILDPRDATLGGISHDCTTPSVFNVDVSIGKTFTVGRAEFECYMLVTNLLNTKQTLNVYPTTGSATDDGALGIQGAEWYLTNPEFLTMRRMLNIENRWSYAVANAPWYNRETLSSGLPDIYGTPRQIRVGIRVGINGG